MANRPPTKKLNPNPRPGLSFKESNTEGTEKPNPNPKPGLSFKESTMEGTKKNNGQFDLCKVCKLNHNLGRRHNYFPNHVKSLSSLLSRFQSKISDVRFFLRNPSLLRPEHASRNRLWCVFCDVDIVEVGSSFACDNAINHLASEDHLRNVKGFMWKYGGGMDRVDSFRVSEADLAKYEKKCISLKSVASAEQSCGPVVGPSNDIHNKVNLEYTNFDPSSINSFTSMFSNGVLPLQDYTNEKIQVSSSELPRLAAVGTCLLDDKSFVCANTRTRASNSITGSVDSQLSASNVWQSSANGSNIGAVQQVYCDERTANGESCSVGLPMLTQISSTAREGDAGNVHSGAPPPWLDTVIGDVLGGRMKHSDTKARKSKLNPKRVGAAWAEKRKLEMEMEKRGELPHNSYDSNWLPNFGGVWQSGSRKESRKKFEVEGKRPFQEEIQPEIPVHIQPYISKRMRQDSSK